MNEKQSDAHISAMNKEVFCTGEDKLPSHISHSFEMLKERWHTKTLHDLLEAINNNPEQFENANVGFKRHTFSLGDYAVWEDDFYGNIHIQTPHPGAICFLCLTIIWHLVKQGHDRFEIILRLKEYFRQSQSENEFIKKVNCYYEDSHIKQS